MGIVDLSSSQYSFVLFAILFDLSLGVALVEVVVAATPTIASATIATTYGIL